MLKKKDKINVHFFTHDTYDQFYNQYRNFISLTPKKRDMSSSFANKKNFQTLNLVKSTTLFSSNPQIEARQGYEQRARQVASIKQRLKIWNRKKKNDKLFQSQTLQTKNNKICFMSEGCSLSLENKEIKRLQISQFVIGDMIGRGATGIAKMAIHKPSNAIVCIKTLQRDKVEQNLSKFIQGLKIQWKMENPHVAKIYGLIVEKKQVHIVMEYCMDGDLRQNLYDVRNHQDKGRQVLLGITKGLKYLHQQSIQHRDLKLENILMIFGVPKISDFDLSVRTLTNFFPRKTICGSPAYFSPEMIISKKYNKKADIWCLGIIFYEVLCGYFPFKVQDENDMKNIVLGKMKDPGGNVDQEGLQLLGLMLEKEWTKRISIQGVMQHKFLQKR